jgi:signal transduction histidine kinase
MQAGTLIEMVRRGQEGVFAGLGPGLGHALEAAIRQRDEAFAVISHDLGQPLSTLQVALPILRDALGETHPDLLGLLRSAESATARMSAMVRELLDMARLQAGEPLRLQRTDVDLVSLLRDGIQFQRTPENVSIVLDACAPSIRGEWDGPRLERAFANLLDNAVKYSPDGGAVTVAVAASCSGGRSWATVEVVDTGIGIPAADLPQLFTRFHRGLNVGQARGTGLGLAGARQIVEQHGGTIDVDSAEGQGTTVTVRLPRT